MNIYQIFWKQGIKRKTIFPRKTFVSLAGALYLWVCFDANRGIFNWIRTFTRIFTTLPNSRSVSCLFCFRTSTIVVTSEKPTFFYFEKKKAISNLKYQIRNLKSYELIQFIIWAPNCLSHAHGRSTAPSPLHHLNMRLVTYCKLIICLNFSKTVIVNCNKKYYYLCYYPSALLCNVYSPCVS